MRQTSKNSRGRRQGRRNPNGSINRNTTLDSNGPDVRLRGNALQLHEKYVSLGNDASAAGERIAAEAYYQHADHYFRLHTAAIAAHEERRNAHLGHSNGGYASPSHSIGRPINPVPPVSEAVEQEGAEKNDATASQASESESTKSDTLV